MRGSGEFMIFPVVEINTNHDEIVLYELMLQLLRFYTVNDTGSLGKEMLFKNSEENQPMNIQAEKIEVAKRVLETEDEGLIAEIQWLIRSREQETSWFDELTEEQQQSVLRELEQADRGELISDEEARKKLGL